MQLKHDSSAADDVRKALSLAPNYLPAMLMQADMALNKGELEQTLTLLRAIQKAHPALAAGYRAEGDLMM